MFDNIGKKIKSLAETISYIGIAASVIFSILFMLADASLESIFLGLFYLIAGAVASWIGSFLLYGFGQLIENTDILVKKFADEPTKNPKDNDEYTYSTPQQNINYKQPSWEQTISELSTEELINRINSKEWQPKYREMCETELKGRKEYINQQ